MEMKSLSCHRLLEAKLFEARVQTEDFSIDREWKACRQRIKGNGGAIVAFAGLVRDRIYNDHVRGLFLEHYAGMTEASIERILNEASERWSLLDVLVIHRVGRLLANEQIVLVLVGATHRADAITACKFIIDFLKTEAVFWKKELRDDSESWIQSTANDFKRRADWERRS